MASAKMEDSALRTKVLLNMDDCKEEYNKRKCATCGCQPDMHIRHETSFAIFLDKVSFPCTKHQHCENYKKKSL